MTDAPESQAEPKSAQDRNSRSDRPNGLNQVLAWVGIFAGVVFILAVVFFSGFFIAGASGHHYFWHHGDSNTGQMGPGQTGSGGMMGSGCMAGQGGMMGPGQMAPAPTTPRR
ncbi:hypothetical protein [Mycobacterium sp. OTB74]|jgi:hypothetical protein|uniref:hypothetical protein n=1 Tax=Mycobacterium sp. OTB74 TaxID=1853452 RepID=UPI0024755E71|nr:hypothetical protein [Mycobacterium sp. OTB74]MDH6247491.1 hypothetical protein [Mycobacterium sp. OTB74]